MICEGPQLAAKLRALGCPGEKITVHHLGVPVSEIPFSVRHWDKVGPVRILLAASFLEKKGLPDAISAISLLRKAGLHVAITVIGDATREKRSRVEKERILGMLERTGLAGSTRLLGYQTHRALLEEACRHHIFLSPSKTASDGDSEGGAPVTLIEMSATGMPVVSTRHGDIPSVVKHGETGYLADEGDVEGLQGHLRYLVDHSDRWQVLGMAGRRHIESEYDAAKLGTGLAGIYRSLL